MKKILIVGKDSYIGTSFERYLSSMSDRYHTDTVGTLEDEWRDFDFSGYDAVYQVAGLAHLKESPEMEETYFRINRDIAVGCAEKAKACGVPLFVYLSTASVYGKTEGAITKTTPVMPCTYYGKSKLEAEMRLRELETESFRVAVLRPPMVYGYGCKGNFTRLLGLVKKLPLFPRVKNRRSFIFVDGLSEFVRCTVDRGEGGLFFPQNKEYVCTSDMARLMAKYSKKKLLLPVGLGTLLRHLPSGTVKKLFGDLYYDMEDDRVETVSFEEGIRLSVTGDGVRSL